MHDLGGAMGQELWIGRWCIFGDSDLGFLGASGVIPMDAVGRGCDFFGPRSFAAGGLSWGCCFFSILWCDGGGGVSKYPVLIFCHGCFVRGGVL